jgi:hypothetical protein
MKNRWYTEDEWSKYIGWGKLPKEYAKPEKDEALSTSIQEKFDYKDENHPNESWDQFIVRKNLKRGMKMKAKPFKTVIMEYYEELDGKFPGRVHQHAEWLLRPGTAGRRIKVVTTTEEWVGSSKDPVKSTSFEYL